MPVHANAPLTPEGRRRLVRLIDHGASLRQAASASGVSTTTAHRWWHRWAGADEASRRSGRCMRDRSSRPHRSTRRMSAADDAPILEARRQTNLGPGRLAHIVGRHRSTIHKVLARNDMSRLRPEPRPATRSYEWSRPGALIHLDTAKLARFAVPGHRTRGRRPGTPAKQGLGYAVVHVAVDDHSRYAYVEIHAHEQGETCARFLTRALAHFADIGMDAPEALMTDNARNYRTAAVFQQLLEAQGIRHILTPPHTPRVNGKAERFIGTLKREWAYAHEWPSSATRARALSSWLRTYNRQRHHSSLGDRPPISRVPNVRG